MKRIHKLLLFALLFQSINPLLAQKNLSVQELKEWMNYLTSDEMKGRRNGSPEMKQAAKWIAGKFKEYHLNTPENQNSYFQEYQFETRGQSINERNVVGILPGKDPELSKEYIIITAHFDHIGIGRSIKGDSIYNGANDNATGTCAVIGIAKLFKNLQLENKRSLVFLSVSGEEMGLHGSRYFSKNPLIPIDQSIMNINFEMIGHCTALGPKKYHITGPGYTNIDELIQKANIPEWERIDTIKMDKMLFNYSDNRSFAMIENKDGLFYGIPSSTFVTHYNEDHIHKPWDEAKYINYENMASFIEYMAKLVNYFANTNEEVKFTFDKFKNIRTLK